MHPKPPFRPRLVARLLEMYMQAEELLGDRTQIPYHKILSQAFCVLTGFQPLDGIIYESTEGEIPGAMIGCSFECRIMTVRKRFEQDGLEQGNSCPVEFESLLLTGIIIRCKTVTTVIRNVVLVDPLQERPSEPGARPLLRGEAD